MSGGEGEGEEGRGGGEEEGSRGGGRRLHHMVENAVGSMVPDSSHRSQQTQ